MTPKPTVAALVPIHLFRRVESSLGSARDARLCSGADEALRLLGHSETRALIVDPTYVTEVALSKVIGFAVERGVPIVVYAVADKTAIDRLLAIEVRAEVTWVMVGGEDEAILLAWSIDPAHGLPAPARVLRHIAMPIGRLDSRLRSAVVALFGGNAVPRGAHGLYAGTHMGDRSAERHLRRVGLQPGTRLLKCARLARAWEVARDDSAALAWIAERAGYESTGMLTDDSHQLIGESFRKAKRARTTPEFSTTVAAAACRSP